MQNVRLILSVFSKDISCAISDRIKGICQENDLYGSFSFFYVKQLKRFDRSRSQTPENNKRKSGRRFASSPA